jgi:hypothetical protein
MLIAMGWEIANCHAGDGNRPPALAAHLRRQPPDWLRDHAKAAARQVEADQKAEPSPSGRRFYRMNRLRSALAASAPIRAFT